MDLEQTVSAVLEEYDNVVDDYRYDIAQADTFLIGAIQNRLEGNDISEERIREELNSQIEN